MSRRDQYEMYYARIEALLQRPIGSLEVGDVIRLQAPGFMDLVVEVLPNCPETGTKVLSLCHYFEQNGGLCQDPEMTVRLFEPSTAADRGRAEALTFQQAIPPVYQEVYPEPGKYYPRLRRELNSFLGVWLRNLEAQGHQPVDDELAGATTHDPETGICNSCGHYYPDDPDCPD